MIIQNISYKFEYYRDLIIAMTQKELKLRYKNSFFGYIWCVAHPLAFALVFYFAFKIIFQISIEDYSLFLIAGLFPWQWFANSVDYSTMVLVGNASIIKKVNFPWRVIPAAAILNETIHFFLTIPVICLFMYIFNKRPTLDWLYAFPCLSVAQFAILYGISLIISSANLFFRDLQKMVSIFLLLMMYCTPIFYSETMIPPKFKFVILANPASVLIINWRKLFMGEQPNNEYLLISIAYGVVSIIIGHKFFSVLSKKFGEVL